MAIWSGLGFLVAVITFCSCLLFNFVLDAQFGDGYYSSHPWAVGAALIVGGIASSIFGFVLKRRTDRILLDELTGERVAVNNSHHTFFFVPMHWAGLAIAVVGAGLTSLKNFN